MRNLKRALSLALASVMLLGMMVVGTSAASYPDVKDSDNVEAIEVLNAVKVMVGDRGNFRPDAAVNRHEMAAIMARLFLGEDAETYVGSHPFTDVYPWADKYVAACYENGLINGTSKTTFSGNQALTAVQAAAMMLRALGYENLQKGASDWRVPVAAKANEIRLFKGVASSPNAQLNRNQVAQLALNTLESTVVSAEIKQDIIVEGIVTIPGEIKYNPVEVTETGLNYNGATTGTNAEKYLQLCEKLYGKDLKLSSAGPLGTDNYGRAGKSWTYKNPTEAIAFRPDSAVVTYTGKVKDTDVEKDLRGYTVSSQDLTIDGTDDSTNAGSVAALGDAIAPVSGKGVTITVYADDTKTVTNVAVINTYIGQVTRVKTEDGETTTTVNKKAGGPESANTFETDAFAKDDYVIYTVGSDGIETMAAAEKVTGKISALSTDYLRLDGTKYDYNAKKAVESGYTPAVKNEIDAYLDAEGNVIYVAKVAAAADDYLYIKGADKYFDTLSVRAVLADGTTKIVELDGDTLIDTSSKAIVAAGTTITGTIKKLSDATDTELGNLVGSSGAVTARAYAYTESDGKYKLTTAGYTMSTAGNKTSSVAAGAIGHAASKPANSTTDTDIKFAIEKDNSTLFAGYKYYTASPAGWRADTGADVVANNDTVYVMVSDGKTYTGFRNVPSMDAVDLVYVTNKDNAKLADLVFITAKTDGADDNASYFYIKKTDKYETQDGYTLWTEAYVNGEKTEIKTKGAFNAAGAGAVIDAAGIYKANKTNSDGYITDVTSVLDKSGINVQAEVASGNTLKLSAANPVAAPLNITDWSYDSETVFVSIDKDGDVTADTSVPSGIEAKSSYVAGDSVYYVAVTERKGSTGKDATTAKVVYVVEADAATPVAPTVQIAGGGTNPVKKSDDSAALDATALTTSTNADITVTFEDGAKDTVKFTINNSANAGSAATATLKVGSADAASYTAGADKDIGSSLDATGITLVLKVTVSGGTFATTEFTYTVKLKTAA